MAGPCRGPRYARMGYFAMSSLAGAGDAILAGFESANWAIRSRSSTGA